MLDFQNMQENQNIEWKESWKDDYLKWVCGFANAQGGIIYIGVNDNGQVVGVENSKKLLEDIPKKIINTLGIVVDVDLLKYGDNDYIKISVNSCSYPVNYKGEYHYRSGSNRQKLIGQSLNDFLLRKMGITWDSVPVCGVQIDDFRNDSFDIFREQALLSKRLDEKDINASNAHLLDNLNLLDDGVLKRAAILLFHHNPEKWIPGAYVKIAFFKSDADLVYQDEIHGSLISQADKVIDLIFTKYLKAEISYSGVVRVETYPYPKEAIREAVFNAIAHKLYSSYIPVQIKVYEDKIYISNDCILPEGWTIDDLMGAHRSKPYNPLIANTFFRAGFIEAWGRGIAKIKDSCAEAGNPMPEYNIKKEEITIMFKSLFAGKEVHIQADKNPEQNDLEEKILQIICKQPEITQIQIAQELRVTLNFVQSIMNRMINSKKIKKDNSSSKEIWIINESK